MGAAISYTCAPGFGLHIVNIDSANDLRMLICSIGFDLCAGHQAGIAQNLPRRPVNKIRCMFYDDSMQFHEMISSLLSSGYSVYGFVTDIYKSTRYT